ncbi:MAG: ABC transporter permease [Sphingobacteriales bacterium]|nr:MAG: ABC transporter permease [Sphingobacteriales bacterium]
MRQLWWKVLCVLLLFYTIIGGFLVPVPRQHIINETIRNLYYHVPMWFTMILLFGGAFIYAIKYLRTGNLKDDVYSSELTKVGIWFSVLGMLTGMEWANYTWGEPWSNDPKQLGTAMSMFIYFAYLILRSGLKDDEKRAKIGAVYNVFAFALLIPLIFILPRMVDSLHPGNGGNPGFNKYDLDSKMRAVFYPAVIGWFLLGLWISTLGIRLCLLKLNKENELF